MNPRASEGSIASSSAEGDDVNALRPRYLKFRLSLMVFIGYAAMGAWVPIFSLHLTNLGFSADHTAWACATNAVGALLAPLLWGQIADRWLATERCIGLCAMAVFAVQWLLAGLTDPWAVIGWSVVNWFFLTPILGLCSSFIFRQLEHPEKDFGKIRLWGTIGWVVAGWSVTLWLVVRAWWWVLPGTEVDLSDSLRIGGLAGFMLAVYALTLPHTPPRRANLEVLDRSGALMRLIDAPLRALGLFRDRSFAAYCGCFFAVYVTTAFTLQLNSLLLKRVGIDAAIIPLFATISQSTGILFLAVLPKLLQRLGMKRTMLVGNVTWTLGLLVFSFGSPAGLMATALAGSGVFICCFVVAGQVFVNRQATHDIRATAQGLLIFISGTGLLLGHLLVGGIRDLSEDNFHDAYLIGAIIAGFAVVVFALGFVSPRKEVISAGETLVPDSEIP